MSKPMIAVAVALMTGCISDIDLSVTEQPVAVTWTSIVGVTPSGASITKTASTAWNAGAISTQTLGGNGYVEFTSGETSTAKMAGLGVGNTGTNYTDIEFAFYLMPGGYVRIYESGAYRGQFGTFSPGDLFRVEVVGTQVQYRVRGTLVYTSTATPTFPLVLDTALYTTAATIQNAEIVDNTMPNWTDQQNVSTSGASITKTGGVGWNAGAVSTTTLSGDGHVEFTSDETSTYKMIGLSNGNSSTGYADIDFAFYLMAGGHIRVYENGAFRKEVGSFAAGDRFRLEVVGSEIRYLVRGAIVYRSTVTPVMPLLLDTALYTTGATVQDVTFGTSVGGAVWENPVGVTMTATSLTKTSGTGWNAGAATVKTLSSDGFVEFTSSENSTGKMAGLSNGDSSVGYSEIDYAFYLMEGGYVRIYENGINRGPFGTYLAGDTFRIQVTGTQVEYLINGALVYTSTVAPTFPLLFDTALYTAGSTIQNVVLSP